MTSSRKLAKARAEELVGWMIRPALSMGKNMRRVLDAPDLALDRLHHAMRASFEAKFVGGPDSFKAWLVELLTEIDVADCNPRDSEERAHAWIAKDPFATRLWPLVECAHARYPNSPLAIIPDPVGWGRAILHACSALQDAGQATGSAEARGRASLNAFAAVADSVYGTYLTKVGILYRLGAGELPSRPPRELGLLCAQVSAAIGDAEIADPDAAHIRNAVVHRHTRHLGRGRFKLWERARALGDEWTFEADAAEILARAQRMHNLAGGLTNALNAFSSVVLWRVFWPVLPQLRPAILGELSPEEAERISAEHNARFAGVFESIPRELFAIHRAGEDPRLAELPATP